VESLVFAAALGALAELGDKSQVMLLILSLRFRGHTAALVIGMVAAMIVAQVPAGLAGAWLATRIDSIGVSWVEGLLFFGMAALALLIDLSERLIIVRSDNIVLTVFVTVLLAEIGDKSPIAAALSSMEEGSPLPLIGTIVGIIAVDLPVAIAGPLLAQRLVSKGINLRWVARLTAVLFTLLGVWAILAPLHTG
jgi:putative Ca2+/H+ antiporter (TMEM165/GDT1 family)